STFLEANRTEFLTLVDTRLESHATRTSSEIMDVRSLVESIRSDSEKRTHGIFDRLNEMDAQFAKLTKNFSTAEWHLRSVEEHVWLLRGIPSNVLITQSQALSSALDAN